MGYPNKTQIESWTDKVAAMVGQDAAGSVANNQNNAVEEMWDLVSSSSDPDVQAALEPAALALSRFNLPSNYNSFLSFVFSRAEYANFCQALNQLVAGGPSAPFADFTSYLVAVSASLNPLFSELFKSRVDGGAFMSGGEPAGVFPPFYRAMAFDKVFAGADGALVDLTAAAGSATAADLTLFASNGHKLYVGSRRRFTHLIPALSTLSSVDLALTAKNWNGNAWASPASLVDNSVGMTKQDTLRWAMPPNWERSFQDVAGNDLPSLERLFYTVFERTQATVVTPPVGTSLLGVPDRVLDLNGADMGVDQPPLALLHITGVNTGVIEVLNPVAFAKFVAPALRLRAGTKFSNNVTVTVSYVDQAAANKTQAQGLWTAPAALDVVPVTLNGADTGAQSIRNTGWAVVTNQTSGVIVVEVPLLRVPAI